MNITSISLLDTKSCQSHKTHSITNHLDIQVLQERETCLIEIDYHVTYCGAYSHSTEVQNGWGVLIQDISPEECKPIHRDQVALDPEETPQCLQLLI